MSNMTTKNMYTILPIEDDMSDTEDSTTPVQPPPALKKIVQAVEETVRDNAFLANIQALADAKGGDTPLEADQGDSWESLAGTEPIETDEVIIPKVDEFPILRRANAMAGLPRPTEAQLHGRKKSSHQPNIKLVFNISGPSKIDALKQAEQERLKAKYPRVFTAPVKLGFTKPLETKTDPTRLLCTVPCHFVPRYVNKSFQPYGDYGVCRRAECTFAHSLAELKLMECRFGEGCHKPGCTFLHPSESHNILGYYKRIGQAQPDLPATSEHSRKPMGDKKPVNATTFVSMPKKKVVI